MDKIFKGKQGSKTIALKVLVEQLIISPWNTILYDVLRVGNRRQYTFLKGQPSIGSWSVAANLVQDLCGQNFNFGSGICGFNNYCTQYESGLTNCQCPPHYTFIDLNRKYKGCKPTYFLQQCKEGSGSSYGFEAIKNLDWSFSDAERLSPISERQCQDECLDDCFCLVVIYKDDGTCWKKFLLFKGKLE